MRVLVLVIASRPAGGTAAEYDVPAYAPMREAWDKHAAQAPEGLDVRFVYGAGGPAGPRDWTFEDVPETATPGILDKTVLALERGLRDGYDAFVRTNLSSFYQWRALLDFLRSQPPERLAAGLCPDRSHLSGCNLVMSRDVAQAVVAATTTLDRSKIDDLAISEFLLSRYAPTWISRLELVFGADRGYVLLHPGDAGEAAFHVRLKNPGKRDTDAVFLRRLVDLYDPALPAETLCQMLG